MLCFRFLYLFSGLLRFSSCCGLGSEVFQASLKSNTLFGSIREDSAWRTVRVKVQRDEDDRYTYEKSSLESLKAFEWLSLHHLSSPDESPRSVVRVANTHAPKSPPPSYFVSKETSKKKAAAEGNHKNVRPSSAPRPRAVLSSPDNDSIIGSKIPARREVLSSLKSNHSSHQNRHARCKISPKSAAAESFGSTQVTNKELTNEAKNEAQAKPRKALVSSSIRPGLRKKITTPSSVQS